MANQWRPSIFNSRAYGFQEKLPVAFGLLPAERTQPPLARSRSQSVILDHILNAIVSPELKRVEICKFVSLTVFVVASLFSIVNESKCDFSLVTCARQCHVLKIRATTCLPSGHPVDLPGDRSAGKFTGGHTGFAI